MRFSGCAVCDARRRFSKRALAAVLPLLLISSANLRAQSSDLPRAHLDWRTARTEHFAFHYPAELEVWTLDVASRFEAVRDAVSALVGYAPDERVDVVVEDPTNISNGTAWPLLGTPTIYLWPTPPDASSSIGASRDWGEIVSVHEYAHIAHLTRPSRNPRRRFLISLLPIRPGPIAIESPRWVVEGYATVVEGAITGSGRPHGALRPAILRQMALEGKLPSYGALNGSDSYYGGSMAYLAGSAYLEWLVARSGDSSLVHLWRRMSARHLRGFDEAFAGAFGDSPSDLYGRFSAELTGAALAVEDTLRKAGLVVGDTIQKFFEQTGAPAISPDDSLLALVRRYPEMPSRIVVLATAPDTAAAARRDSARAALLRADSLDVLAVRTGPPPLKEVASLRPISGRGFDAPRFMPDGNRILVSRREPLGDGAWRWDLSLWNWRSGEVRRVTHGAGIHDADPHPDGSRAVAARCLNGICDIVEVKLTDGSITVLLPGRLGVVVSRPRYSPDGERVAFTRTQSGRARIVVMHSGDASTARNVDPEDGVNRYDPAWLPDGSGLVVVSEAGGIANLERLSIQGGPAATLTRVTGAATAPEPAHGGDVIYFLSLHSKGLDLHSISVPAAGLPLIGIPASYFPAAQQPVVTADTFALQPVRRSVSYGMGPRRRGLFPATAAGAEGNYGALALYSTDPVGRFAWIVEGAYGSRSTWRGAGLSATWRGTRPVIELTGFYAEQRPSEQGVLPFPTRALDENYWGGAISFSRMREFGSGLHLLRAGVSLGVLDPAAAGERESRRFAFAEYSAAFFARPGERSIAAALQLRGASGSTTGADWTRGRAAVQLSLPLPIVGQIQGAATAVFTQRDAPVYEQTVVGGLPAPFISASLLGQRLTHPALPLGITGGSEVFVWRVAKSLGGLEPYYWSVSSGSIRHDVHRLVGIEIGESQSAIPFMHLPDIGLTAGAAFSLDSPFRRHWRLYGGIRVGR